jgi:hypothetical protein
MSTIQKSLETMAKMLDRVVGVTKTVDMTLPQFVAYATGQIAKASTDAPALATARLKALQHAVTVVKDNYIDDQVDSFKVPITFPDTTSMDEKQNQLIDALANAKPGPDESAFSNGFVAKVQALIDSLKTSKAAEGEGAAEDEDEEGDDEETKAKKAASRKAKADAATASQGGGGDVEDEEKAKKAGGSAADPDDEEKARKAKAPPFGGAKAPPFGKKPPTPPAPPGKDGETDKTKKSLGGDVEWPSDMADPDFVEHGKTKKSLAWGRDGEK